ncbi:DNA polymerase III subunit chi [Methylophaga nitratireducenticrescens]|uniref:DNA polymerase III subunit chi n=1 Tax=Methylophaga nitratireducenticrescens TaxID=754476 RepID=UPI000CDBAFCC|nr:DNA polymerase III subunit chi [Methylophaga nitratireducenticrescens]AUZ85037.1 DNA polymerase III subunit chi [Methylophaga nitratireducenticrescens]
MTKVSFYILGSTDPLDRQQFACRLAEKAYLQGHQVFIHTEDQTQSEAMDQALWAFRPDSFVPHQVLATDNKIEAPVLISHENTAPPKLMDVLINLNPVQPLFFSQFERLAEIINGDEAIKKQGRVRYQFYKDRGYHLDTHQINN